MNCIILCVFFFSRELCQIFLSLIRLLFYFVISDSDTHTQIFILFIYFGEFYLLNEYEELISSTDFLKLIHPFLMGFIEFILLNTKCISNIIHWIFPLNANLHIHFLILKQKSIIIFFIKQPTKEFIDANSRV